MKCDACGSDFKNGEGVSLVNAFVVTEISSGELRFEGTISGRYVHDECPKRR